MANVNMAWLYAITKFGYPPKLANFHEAMEDAVRLGFQAIEIEVYGEQNLIEVEEGKKELKDHLSRLNLKVVNLAAIFRQVVSSETREKERGLSLFARAADLANYFGSPMIQTDTFSPPIQYVGKRPYGENIVFGEEYKVRVPSGFSWLHFWKNLVSSMKSCSAIAREHGLLFTVEPRIGETISNSDAMLSLMNEVEEDNFGAVLDTGHLHSAKELLPVSIEKLNKKIFYVHLSDNDGRDNYHRAPGKGTIDWDGVFEGLRKYNFKGYVAIDVGGKDIDDLEVEVVSSRVFAEQMYNKYLV